MKKISLMVSLVMCSFFFLMECAYFWGDGGYDPLVRQTEDGLPVFYIHPVPASTSYSPGTLYYRGQKYDVETRIHGKSTRNLPMKSFTIQFSGDRLFTDSEFGFYNEHKVILLASFNDNSFIRNRMAFDIWNMIDTSHIQVHTYNAVVYLNGVYWGLYTVCEKVDGFLMEENGLWRDGNLYKAISHDANFFLKENPHLGFIKEEGYPEDGDDGAYRDLDDLVTYISTADPDNFLDTIDGILKQSEYEEWWMYVMFMTAGDSAEKNSFHYHNPEQGVWRYIPWDFNSSFGQSYLTKRVSPLLIPNFHLNNNIFGRFFELDTLRTSMHARFIDFLSPGNILDLNGILSKINEYDMEIHDAAVKSEAKWREEYRNFSSWKSRTDFTTYEEEIEYIKNWLTVHYSELLIQYDQETK